MEIKAKIVGNGNIKLGNNIGTWSTLYGDKEYETPFGMVKGTCSGRCSACSKSCYVRKSYRYGSVIKRHAANTIAMRENINKCFGDLNLQLSRKRKPFDWVRIDQSGEIENEEQFQGWIWLAKNHPESHFYVYTKAYDFVIPEILKRNVPNNMTILISVWHDQGIMEYMMLKHIPNVKAFVYMDKNTDKENGWGIEEYASKGIDIRTTCKAYGEDGKLDHNITCEKCQKCMNRVGNCKVVGCNDH